MNRPWHVGPLRGIAVVAFSLAAVSAASAQSQGAAAANPRLEAATAQWLCAHLGRGGGCDPREIGPPTYDPSRFICRSCTADALIVFAFNLATSAQDKGLPGWAVADAYRVEIVPSSPATDDQMMQLLQGVVVKAFGLRYHIEDQPSRVYRLTIGKGGPKFRRSGQAEQQTRGALMAGNYQFSSVGELVTWLNRFHYLSGAIRYPVEDGTGMKGDFDIELKMGAGTMPAELPLIELVKKQLGLDPVVVPGHTHYLVIDSIQHFHGRWTSP
ncbi:MAG: TIGR03435 family protein [Terriglobales bacterium]